MCVCVCVTMLSSVSVAARCCAHCPLCTELCEALPCTVGGEICAVHPPLKGPLSLRHLSAVLIDWLGEQVFDTEPSVGYDESLTQLVEGEDEDEDMVLL